MNCKPGDLAYVVRDSGSGALGVIVEVLRRSDRPDGTPAWMVLFPEGYELSYRANGTVLAHNQARIPDAWLRPISGILLDDETPIGEPIKTNLPEAFRLAFGIEMQIWA